MALNATRPDKLVIIPKGTKAEAALAQVGVAIGNRARLVHDQHGIALVDDQVLRADLATGHVAQ